jgi:D-alanyl-D-alanine carboxypeptidase/D-alanyl-D-alanine-endopeptidase (penicillin-binding protein 4)
MPKGKVKVFLVLFLFFSLCKAHSANILSVREKLKAILSEPILHSVHVGMELELLGSRKVIFSYNAHQSMIPASNLKILTTGCTLLNFGPNYRFTTFVMGNGIDNHGILQGDLILKGSGDPTWNTDFYPTATTPLEKLADVLKEHGLKEVAGDLVVDDSIFSREFTGIGWKKRYEWEDYASQIAGVSLNYNQVLVSVLPGKAIGDPVQVEVYPPNDVLHVINHASTTSGYSALYIHRQQRENQVEISGHLSRNNRGVSFSFNIFNPPLFVGSVFKEILAQKGIHVLGHVREIRSYEMGKISGDPIWAEIQSPPLLKIVRFLNKNSINFLAEHLFRALGAHLYGKGSLLSGKEAVCSCLSSLHVSYKKLVMKDGSGLSDLDRVTPHMLVSFLQAIATKKAGIFLKSTFPKGGVDGTLQYRLNGVKVQAKTGAIRHVSSLSGYLTTRYGQTVVFSIILNNFSFSADEADILIDKMVRAIADARGPL